MSDIGTLNEGSLHAALKDHYAQAGDHFEVPLEGFVIDIVRPGDPPQLIEVQTGSFGALGHKLDRLLDGHRVLLVHPIAATTLLERADSRNRRSPKKGAVHDVFDELVSIPTLLSHPFLELDVVLVETAARQEHDPRARRGRGGYRTVDRRLLSVQSTHRFRTSDDLLAFLPDDLPDVFTTGDIASRGGVPRATAQRIAYCLRSLELITIEGRGRGGIRYERTGIRAR